MTNKKTQARTLQVVYNTYIIRGKYILTLPQSHRALIRIFWNIQSCVSAYCLISLKTINSILYYTTLYLLISTMITQKRELCIVSCSASLSNLYHHSVSVDLHHFAKRTGQRTDTLASVYYNKVTYYTDSLIYICKYSKNCNLINWIQCIGLI